MVEEGNKRRTFATDFWLILKRAWLAWPLPACMWHFGTELRKATGLGHLLHWPAKEGDRKMTVW